MRKAGSNLRQMLIENPMAQDALETALWAGGSAAYQGIFTDMSAEDIAKTTALGAGVAMAARPLGGLAGRRLGKAIDTRAPHAFDGIQAYVPVTRDGSAAILNDLRKGSGGSNNAGARAIRDVLKAKRNLSSPDAGTAEAILGYYLRNRADNIAQGGIAIAAPLLMGGNEDA